jgi:hypothetical protein
MASAADNLAQKLEAFSKTLSPEELSTFAAILQPKGQLTDKDLESASGGAISLRGGHLAFQSVQTSQFSSALFRRLMDW